MLPVPPPSSITTPGAEESICSAIAEAKLLLLGSTAPRLVGLRSQSFRKHYRRRNHRALYVEGYGQAEGATVMVRAVSLNGDTAWTGHAPLGG